MSTKTKTVTYTANDRAIVAALKGADHPMTLAEINEKSGLSLKPGSMTSAIRKGLITKSGTIKVKRPSYREVATYAFITSKALTNKDGKAYNYTPTETAILHAAEHFSDTHNGSHFTLAELSEEYGSAPVKSGNIVSLVKKGNLAKMDETRAVGCMATSTVSTYVFAADVPEDVPAANSAADHAEAETTPEQA